MIHASLSSPRPADPPASDVAGGTLREYSFPAFGTRCELRFAAPAPGVGDAFVAATRAWVERFEARYSRFRPESIVANINRAAGAAWIAIDAEAEQMLEVCAAVHHLTGGLIDATTGALAGLWDYRRPAAVPPAPDALAAARACVGWPLVRREPGRVFLPRSGMALDFGGWGKEWAVDAIAQLAVQHGLTSVLIDFGHDLRGLGTPPGRPAWHIGLEDPAEPGQARGSLALTGGRGVACSGDYLRGFTHAGRRYGHILDPRTGCPVANGNRQATVLAANCFTAGLLATSAFILGPAEGLEFLARFPGAEALLLHDSGRAVTRGFWHHVVS